MGSEITSLFPVFYQADADIFFINAFISPFGLSDAISTGRFRRWDFRLKEEKERERLLTFIASPTWGAPMYHVLPTGYDSAVKSRSPHTLYKRDDVHCRHATQCLCPFAASRSYDGWATARRFLSAGEEYEVRAFTHIYYISH